MNTFRSKYPLLAYDYSEMNEQEYAALRGKYLESLETKAGLLPQGNLYLGSRLHDSRVLSIAYNARKIKIELNDECTYCFAAALADTQHIRLPREKMVFPIYLNFTGVTHFSIAWINRNQKILPIRKEKYLPRISEFISDEVTRLDDQFTEAGMLFWAIHCDRKKLPLLLQVKSQQLTFEEGQQQAFLRLFGEDKLGLFERFWNERLKGLSFDYSGALNWLRSSSL